MDVVIVSQRDNYRDFTGTVSEFEIFALISEGVDSQSLT